MNEPLQYPIAVSEARIGVETALIPIPMPFTSRSPVRVLHAVECPDPLESKVCIAAQPMEVPAIKTAAMKIAPLLPAIWFTGSESGQPLDSFVSQRIGRNMPGQLTSARRRDRQFRS